MTTSSSRLKVLVVDNDALNLDLIANYLAESEYHLTCTNYGQEALELLLTKPTNFDMVLLDRKMSQIDGMEILITIKQHPALKHLPIIIQTAQAQTKEIAQGIRAGAFYYLTKPFGADMLISIMAAAAEDVKRRRISESEKQTSKINFGLVDQCKISVKTLSEARTAAVYLSQLYPDSEAVLFGIHELTVNAIEHGNLGVGYASKTLLLKNGLWIKEIEQRLQLPQNKTKKVEISYYRGSENIKLYIKDSGNGFNWRDYMKIAPHRATDNHGRGIAISNIMSFNEITYLGGGNEVCCVVNLAEKVVRKSISTESSEQKSFGT